MTQVLLLGDAASVYEDAKKACQLFVPEVVAATNNIGIHWEGHVDHWFTLHPQPAHHWVGIEQAVVQRIRAGRNKPFTWAHKDGKGIDFVTTDWGGSSGLFAIKGLLEIGCRKIVLAGIPMTKEGAHYYEETEWFQAQRYHKAWLKHHDLIAPHIKSMSGWTMEQFGMPTPDWLEEGELANG